MAAKALRLSNVNHAAGIFADMSVDGPAIGTLVAIVDRAKNLPNRKTMGKQNPYCAARLGKEARKTDTDLRGGQTPRWDQELRFTVHESPDYLRMKLSVFNDDKRTDLIGETWIDLKNLIIPGGSQSDQWHTLQFRGKYAGEIRLEMTYYDTRPADEAVIERRTQGVERPVSAKHNTAPVPAHTLSSSSSSSLSGPRQLKEVKRRPVPTDPAGLAARPAPEKAHSSPGLVPVASQTRPAPYENMTRPSSSGLEYAPPPRHTAPPEPQYDTPHGIPLPPAHQARTYETPDDFQRDWNGAGPSVSYPVPAGQLRRPPQGYSQEPPYPSHRDNQDYYARPHRPDQDYYARPRSGYDNAPPVDYRYARPDIAPARQDLYHESAMLATVQPSSAPGAPRSGHYSHSYPAQDQYGYIEEPPARRYHASSVSSRHRVEYQQEIQDPDRHYRQHRNSLTMRGRSPGRSGRESQAEYAAMQPRVDDEEEEGPPPPPPVHRSGLINQQLVPSPSPSYHAYSPEYGPRPTQEMNMPQPPNMMLEEDRSLHDLPPVTNDPTMPPSLVAGLDPEIADAESDRVVHEIQARRRSGIFEEDLRPRRSREPSPVPPYPTEAPVEERRRSIVSRRSMNEDAPQQLVLRKSVSPRPPPSRGRDAPSQIPFSPDSFDSFNPHAAQAAVSRDPAPAYETPAEAMEAARRSEAAASRTDGPIIGDDGREIDPSDHLPTETWAPEPDRKSRKSGVVVRFKSPASRTPPRALPAPARDSSTRPTSMYGSSTDLTRVSPRGVSPGADINRGRQAYSTSPGRTYSTSPQPRRKSISPAPSPLYAPATVGPPIPAKVPIAAPPVYGQDALSRELNSIDIGAVGYSSSRAMRKYVPNAITGYSM
ncbi:hypothetical protein BJX61DRAFT_536812 [Aspergillus egyptiacus]|nr:hypothetical protein BJX61DRAFT_536812 [Aspergillus egyptiacus]